MSFSGCSLAAFSKIVTSGDVLLDIQKALLYASSIPETNPVPRYDAIILPLLALFTEKKLRTLRIRSFFVRSVSV